MIGLVFIILLACGGHHPRPAQFSTDPAPLLAVVDQHGSGLNRLRAELNLEVWRGDQRIRITEFLALDEKGRLRFDILTPFGQPLTTVVSDGKEISVLDLESKRFRVGDASAENLARLLPIELSPTELVSVLKGRPPQIEYKEARVSWNGERGWYRLELLNGRDKQTIELDPSDQSIRRIRHWRGQQLRYDAQFAKYEGASAARLPIRMRFEFPRSKARIDVKVVHHEINPDLPSDTFHLEAPQGMPLERF